MTKTLISSDIEGRAGIVLESSNAVELYRAFVAIAFPSPSLVEEV